MKKWLLFVLVLMLALTSTAALADEPPHSMEITLGLVSSYTWSIPSEVILYENPTGDQKNQFILEVNVNHLPVNQQLVVKAPYDINTNGIISLRGQGFEGAIQVNLSAYEWYFSTSRPETIVDVEFSNTEQFTTALAGTYVSDTLVFTAAIEQIQ